MLTQDHYVIALTLTFGPILPLRHLPLPRIIYILHKPVDASTGLIVYIAYNCLLKAQ